jgi:hypothetical protein
MASPAIRLIDSAAGIVVLALLLVAVIGGQAQLNLPAQAIDHKQELQSQIRNAALMSDAKDASEISMIIGSGESVPARWYVYRETRSQDNVDDLTQSIAE